MLKTRIVDAINDISHKKTALTIKDLRRLLFRCASSIINLPKVSTSVLVSRPSITALQCEYDLLHYIVMLPFEAFSPSAISAGIEAWSWVISEKPEYEIALMTKITSAWMDTIRLERGLFSKSLK